jgi:hypothetical protein
MSDGFEELDKLAATLEGSGAKASVEARRIVQKGSLNIKNEARQFASGIAHAPQYPDSITYETHDRLWGAEGIIGPDKGRPQGALGNILEYGTSKNAPLTHLAPALDREEPGFVKALEDAAEKAVDL